MAETAKPKGLQRKTPLKRGNAPLRRSKPLKADPAKGLKADPAKGLKRKPIRTSPEKMRERMDKERARAQEKARERRQSAPLERKKGLKASKGLSASPKPRKRPSRPAMTAEEKACRRIVSDRSEGMCEKCGVPGALEKAHRVARSHGGRWDASNVLDLCHDCHHGNHGAPQVAYDHGWHLRGHVEDTPNAPVLLRKGWRVGWALLDNKGGYEWVDGPAWDEKLVAPRT